MMSYLLHLKAAAAVFRGFQVPLVRFVWVHQMEVKWVPVRPPRRKALMSLGIIFHSAYICCIFMCCQPIKKGYNFHTFGSDKHAGFFIRRTLSSLNLSLEETEKLKEKYVFAETMSREDALKKVREKLLLCNIQQRKFPLKMPMKGADVFVYDEELRQVCRLRRPEYCIADRKSKRMGDLLISVKTCSAREHQNASDFFITCPHVLLVRKTLKSL